MPNPVDTNMNFPAHKKIAFIALVLAYLLPSTLLAQIPTKYVTDDFEVMLRTGPSIQNKIVKPLRSGTSIQILREDAGNGHSQVKISSGEIGYMLTRFISPNSSARNQLARLRKQIKQLRSKPGEIKALLATAQEENQALIDQNLKLTNQLSTADEKITKIETASGNALSISERNQKLENEVQQLLLQLDDIRIQNQALKDNADYVRNLTMTGILVLGLFLGWILSRSGKRRRNSWGS